MVRFYTWRDIEILLEKHRSTWPENWNDVQVYNDEVVIYYDKSKKSKDESDIYLKTLFTKNYDLTNNKLLIDFSQTSLDVIFEEEVNEQKRERKTAPLFKDIYLRDTNSQEELEALPGARIMAFHSYKGGVGRTLSLISLLRECSSEYENKKILVIDADLEAPGLTWMVEGQTTNIISYIDILSVMHFNNCDEEMLNKLAETIKLSTINVTTDKNNVEQYFVPVSRKENQVMDIFSSPERILSTQENKFYITETISRIGAALGVDLILVDLRAGIAEFSAPFIFDPRVEKIYVTSTSKQSIKGLNQILELVYNKTKTEFLKSKILLTMIPSTMDEEQKRVIEDQLLGNIENLFDVEGSTFLRENYIIRVQFEDSLIHITDLADTFAVLKESQMSRIMNKLTKEIFTSYENNDNSFTESEVRERLKSLYEIARDEITAEGNNSANMLVTSSIKELVKNFKTSLPRVVIPGAKGSGKTYMYKQLLAAKTWQEFQRIAKKDQVSNIPKSIKDEICIIPLVASINVSRIKPSLDACFEYVNSKLPGFEIKHNIVNDNFSLIQKYLEGEINQNQSNWTNKWIEIILNVFQNNFSSLEELDLFLEKQSQKIIFIVDGLEDIFLGTQYEKNENWKYGLRSICQYVINKLDYLDYGNIGIMVFARKDMLDEAIDTNNEQFNNLYSKYELNWSQTEALRLALWLGAQAYPAFLNDINVLTATREVIADKLTKLWGLKLGKADSKEAFSDRWILAALSDFNGQLQARDIVRFLRYSTQSYKEMKIIYNDRLIMPTEIRNAIEPCSKDKMAEIKSEMKVIYSILNKFAEMEPEKKTLPITLEEIELTGEQISRLESQGYLKIVNKQYYLPEIIRLALGFRYEKGARPKVLSLLVQ